MADTKEIIEAKEELDRLKEEGKYTDFSIKTTSYDAETEIDERVW